MLALSRESHVRELGVVCFYGVPPEIPAGACPRRGGLGTAGLEVVPLGSLGAPILLLYANPASSASCLALLYSGED